MNILKLKQLRPQKFKTQRKSHYRELNFHLLPLRSLISASEAAFGANDLAEMMNNEEQQKFT